MRVDNIWLLEMVDVVGAVDIQVPYRACVPDKRVERLIIIIR